MNIFTYAYELYLCKSGMEMNFVSRQRPQALIFSHSV